MKMKKPPNSDQIVVAECEKCNQKILLDTISEIQNERMRRNGFPMEVKSKQEIIKEKAESHAFDCEYNEKMTVEKSVSYTKICKYN